MAAQNVLAGNEELLKEIIREVKEQNARIEQYNKLNVQIKDISRSIDEEKKNLQATTDAKIKESSVAICTGYDESISEEKNKIRDIQSKRERAKDAGVKERILNETAELRNENKQLKIKISDAFKADGVPAFCNNKVFMLLFRTSGFWQYFLYIVLLIAVYAVVPYGLLMLPTFPVKCVIIYYMMCIMIQTLVGKVVYRNTVLKHFNTLDMAARIQMDIKDNSKRIRKISRKIKRDKNEEMYGLETFDERIAKVRKNINQIEKQKRAALEEFEDTVKPNIISELEMVDKDKREAMYEQVSDMRQTYAQLGETIKEKRMYISSNYEAYLGKEVFDIDKLQKLQQIMKSGEADTIAKAIAVYDNKSQN